MPGVGRLIGLAPVVALALGLLVAVGDGSAGGRTSGEGYPARIDRFIQQGLKLVGASASAFTTQGESVVLSGDGGTALVGGPADNSGAGAAWVFTRPRGVWSQQAKLVGLGAIGKADQGLSVALSADGSTALVGGPHDDNMAGAAWVFTRAHGVWSQQAKLVGSGAIGNGGEGSSVALSGDGNIALIGGPNGSEPGASEGAAWVFTRVNGVWSQQAKLVGSDASTFADEGLSVALSYDGGTALIGGPSDNGDTGAGWVFTREGGAWRQQGPKLVGADSRGASQGWSVALSSDGDTALMGAPSAGGGWVFTRLNGVWSQEGAKLVGRGAAGDTRAGNSVALSGDGNTALIGAPSADHSMGTAWQFARANGAWTQQGAELVGSGARGDPEQGWSVALSGDADTALIGGPGDSDGKGATWVFESAAALAQPSNKFTASDIRPFADGTITFSVKVPGPGTIDVLETAWKANLARAAVHLQPAPGRFVFARARRITSHAGTVRVSVPPNARGRLLVAHHTYRVTLRLWISYTPRGGRSRSVGFRGLHLPPFCADPDRDGDCEQ